MNNKINNLIRNYIRETFIPYYGISYTGVRIEDPNEIHKLEVFFQKTIDQISFIVPDNWKSPEDYHMTICLDELPLHLKMRGDLNSEVVLTITHIGYNTKAIAFKVTGYMSKNEVQHITMRFLDKPADSKEIVDWYPLKTGLELKGYIREVAKKQP